MKHIAFIIEKFTSNVDKGIELKVYISIKFAKIETTN